MAAEFSDSFPTICAAGSLGRMEALPHSDADLILFIEDKHPLADETAQHRFNDFWQQVEALGYCRPKPNGVFSAPESVRQMLDRERRGVIAEEMGVFGRRIQSLLDAQPICAPNRFHELQARILDWYLEVSDRGDGTTWRYLLNDLVRYHRSLCVRTQWISNPVSHRLLNLKLRHSRRLNFAGLLISLGESTTKNEAQEFLLHQLQLTPLERVYASCHDSIGDRLLMLYDRFLCLMSQATSDSTDSSTDNAMDSIVTISDENARELFRNALELESVLLDAIKGRQVSWDPRFQAALLLG